MESRMREICQSGSGNGKGKRSLAQFKRHATAPFLDFIIPVCGARCQLALEPSAQAMPHTPLPALANPCIFIVHARTGQAKRNVISKACGRVSYTAGGWHWLSSDIPLLIGPFDEC